MLKEKAVYASWFTFLMILKLLFRPLKVYHNRWIFFRSVFVYALENKWNQGFPFWRVVEKGLFIPAMIAQRTRRQVGYGPDKKRQAR